MRATIKRIKNLNGITKEELFENRRVIRFSNSLDTVWKDKKRYAF